MSKNKVHSLLIAIICILIAGIIILPQLNRATYSERTANLLPSITPGFTDAPTDNQTTPFDSNTPNNNVTDAPNETYSPMPTAISTNGIAQNNTVAPTISSANKPTATNNKPISTIANQVAPTSAPTAATTKKVVGYYASWSAYSGYTPLNIQASKLTDINYAFANIDADLKITMGDPNIDPFNFAKLNELKKSYPNINTLISIGGWTWSDKFSDVCLSENSRTIFADSVVAFIMQYGFNGVDIDWEYPVGGGLPTNIYRPEDKTNFTLLLKMLREKLDAQGAIDGNRYFISVAGGAGSNYVKNTELNQIYKYIDYANVMTYDIHGPWEKYSDFNAPLFDTAENTPQDNWSLDSSVKAWMASGFPASKIVVGIPFYGYVYNGVSGSNNGLYSTYTSSNSIGYDKLVSKYLSDTTFIQYFQTSANAPYISNGSTFITYDDAHSIIDKAKYISQNNFAGAAIWELSQNKDGTLLTALSSNLK